MIDFTGRTALVTGASSGIGLATARALASRGARVAITGRRPEALETAAGLIGPDTLTYPGDVADPAHHRAVAERLREAFGSLDIYMANAGLNTITRSDRVSEAEYDSQFDTNARGTFFGVQTMGPLLRDGGTIILTGSIAATKNLAGHAVYAGSKAALLAFARSWAIEFSPRRIRVNVLSPGPTDTAILRKLGVAETDRPAFEAGMASAIPLGRMARSEELADAALFLAGDESRFVTGVELRVDGGMVVA